MSDNEQKLAALAEALGKLIETIVGVTVELGRLQVLIERELEQLARDRREH